MSTTAIVTPYDPEKERVRNELAVREEHALAEHREAMRKELLSPRRFQLPAQCSKELLSTCRLQFQEQPRMLLQQNSLSLNTSSLNLVGSAAKSIGYIPRTQTTGRVELVHPSGSLLMLSLSKSGKVELTGNRENLTDLKSVTREYSALRLVEYFKEQRMEVRHVRTVQGEIIIEAKARTGEKVTADVRQEGIVVLDVNGVKGKKCQDIITAITRATECSQIDTKRKASYFINESQSGSVHV